MNDKEIVSLFNFNNFVMLVYKKIFQIIIVAFIAAVLSYFISYSFDNYYRSKAVIASSSIDVSGASSLSQGQGGIGSLFQSFSSFSPGSSNIRIVKEIGLSRDFILSFINEYDLKPILLASEDDSDPKNGKVNFIENIYDSKNKIFVSKEYLDKDILDTASYETFMQLINIDEQPIYPILTVTFDFIDASVGTEILNKFIIFLDNHLENRVIKRAERIEEQFLNLLSKGSFLGLNDSIANEILKQVTLQLYGGSDITSQFFILESAHSIDKRIKPNRPLVVLISGALVALIHILTLMVFHKEELE